MQDCTLNVILLTFWIFYTKMHYREDLQLCGQRVGVHGTWHLIYGAAANVRCDKLQDWNVACFEKYEALKYAYHACFVT